MTDLDGSDPSVPTLTCQAVYLLTGLGVCHACGQRTRLFTLMALPPIEFEDAQDDDGGDEEGCMLSYVGRMPKPLDEQVLARTDGLWRPDFSVTAGAGYWMNHCEHCGAKQGDHFVQEPNGPFWPYTEAEMDAIGAERLEGPHEFYEASVAGGVMNAGRDRRHGVARVELQLPRRGKDRGGRRSGKG